MNRMNNPNGYPHHDRSDRQGLGSNADHANYSLPIHSNSQLFFVAVGDASGEGNSVSVGGGDDGSAQSIKEGIKNPS